jgi:acylphosphatase
MSGKPISVMEGGVEKKFLVAGNIRKDEFRSFLQQAADRNEVEGRVSRLVDGVVAEVLARGASSKVEAFKQELICGPTGANVEHIQETILKADYFPFSLMTKIERGDVHSVILFLLGPDPLETLCLRVVGLPDNQNQEVA